MTTSDAQPDRALSARIAEIRQGLDVARFAGSSPAVEIPGDPASLDVVAHVLAAERSACCAAGTSRTPSGGWSTPKPVPAKLVIVGSRRTFTVSSAL